MSDSHQSASFPPGARRLLDDLERSPQNFARAVEAGRQVSLVFPAEAVDDIVIAGMGSSASVAHMVVAGLWDRLRKPIHVVQGYGLPGWAAERTLVIGLTFSGETEETLTCVADAVDRTCPVVGISTGGKMTSFYGPAGVAIVEPPSASGSRGAGPALLGALVAILERVGAIHDSDRDIADAGDRLEALAAAYGAGSALEENPAKQLAKMLVGTLPSIWGAQMTAPIARRWRDQISAIARMPALAAEFPEHNHAELAGMEGYADASLRPTVVVLRNPRHHRQVERRLDAVRTVASPHIAGSVAVSAQASTDLGRLVDLMMLGDAAAIYCAAEIGRDPDVQPLVAELTDHLAVSGYGRTAG